MADGRILEVLNVIDDHSRLCVASRAFVTTRSHRRGAQPCTEPPRHWGYPESLLTDNGAIFTASCRGGMAAMESELLSLGIASKHSRPYHPQTCGKVERFHQTPQEVPGQAGAGDSPRSSCRRQLDRFVAYYNDVRPHRGIGRRTPAEVFAARERAYPDRPPDRRAGYRVRHDKVSTRPAT